MYVNSLAIIIIFFFSLLVADNHESAGAMEIDLVFSPFVRKYGWVFVVFPLAPILAVCPQGDAIDNGPTFYRTTELFIYSKFIFSYDIIINYYYIILLKE